MKKPSLEARRLPESVAAIRRPSLLKYPAFTWPGKRRKRPQRRLFQWRSRRL